MQNPTLAGVLVLGSCAETRVARCPGATHWQSAGTAAAAGYPYRGSKFAITAKLGASPSALMLKNKAFAQGLIKKAGKNRSPLILPI